VKTSRNAIIYSRNGKTSTYSHFAEALGDLPADTVVDVEVVALNDSGRPDFHVPRHFKASASRIHYFLFDLLVLHGRDLTNMPLTNRASF
jgi:bifunctional non-homologous end joining protein LigD